MRFNEFVGSQELSMMKRMLVSVDSATKDNEKAIQHFSENGLVVAEDGSVRIGELVFTKTMLQTLYEMIV